MSQKQKDMIDYIVICINEFAKRYSVNVKEAFLYLHQYQGITFLEEEYDIEHTFSFEDAVDHLTLVCKEHGGILK